MGNRVKAYKLFVCLIVFVVITFLWISDSLSGSTVKERIVVAPHPVLRQKAALIDRQDHEAIQLLIEMADYLDDSVRPIAGISLPQVAVSKRGFIVMIDEEAVIMINPQITKLGQDVPSLEGCLSLPGQYGYVNRNSSILVEYHDEDWEKQTLRLEQLYAFAVQHEHDHLDGILITDKMLADVPVSTRNSDIPLE
ncbi:peptide deformylase [Sporomusa sp.]|uniref:peptide deformylase n=1 Tax=Sporomusa sp. TaxID=2078658 RepID=UPI002BFBE04F|nr:peptide deformylase [Sporomusa sp.]HWR41768.1 peptide deformylase [Sporomusa sp.]